MVRGILFDLDGTLVDRAATLAVFAQELADAFAEDLDAFEMDDFLRRVVAADGQGYREKVAVFARLCADLPWRRAPAPDEIGDFWWTIFPKCTQPMAGVYAVLDTLQAQGIKMGIVTNGSARSQHGKIDRLDLQAYMETVVVSETVGVKKPDAGIFEAALAGLGVPAAEVWFVGDHPQNDIVGAEAMGMAGVWISGHLPWPEDQPSPARRIDRLDALPALLAGANGAML